MNFLKFCLGVVWVASVLPSSAGDCSSLKVVATAPLQPVDGGMRETVSVALNGVQKVFVLDTGGYTSQVAPAVADELKLPISGRLGSMKFIGGASHTLEGATIADFLLGTMHAKDMPMLVSPINGLGADGLLAPDLFLAYDLDMDFGHDKLNFVSSDHCPGKVIYWKSDVVAAVPMRIVNGHYLINITLDGQSLVAVVDTGAMRSSIGAKEAMQHFGLSPDSPGAVGGQKVNGTVASFMYKFGALSFDGVSVQSPDIAVLQSDAVERDRAARGAYVVGNTQLADMILGMDIMRHLHVYIATKERKLYITPA